MGGIFWVAKISNIFRCLKFLIFFGSNRWTCSQEGVTLIFSDIIFWVQNFEFQYFWGFQKNDFFGGLFLRSRFRMGVFFGSLKF